MNIKDLFTKKASTFKAETEKNERGQIVYFRGFNKQQLIGKIIRVNKHTAFRVTTGAILNAQSKMENCEHELRKFKIR